MDVGLPGLSARSPIGSGLRIAGAFAAALIMNASSAAGARLITVVSGTYGQNCGASQGNATADLAHRCNGRSTCEYSPDGLAAPRNAAAGSCRADLVAEWRCTDSEMHTAALSVAANADDVLVLSCVWQTGPGH